MTRRVGSDWHGDQGELRVCSKLGVGVDGQLMAVLKVPTFDGHLNLEQY